MSGIFLLDWAALAVSLAITMLLVWLALVVFLNSEHRTWGIYLTSGGLLLGAFFFVAHSVLLAQSFNYSNPWLDVWWQIGWIPVILSPFAWYLVVLWYAGFWESTTSALHRRQRFFLYLNSIFTVMLVGLVLFGHPIPSYWESIRLDFTHVPLSVFGIPMIIVILPAYILFCLGLAVDALLRPGPTRRPLADVARSRARPWLLASSLLLVVVSLLVGWVLLHMLLFSRSSIDYNLLVDLSITLAKYDLLIATITGLSILCLGQAIISYEIFTGKALPRQGLRRYYFSAVLLFGGISLFVAGAYTLRFSTIYGLLLVLLITTAYFAILTWRSFLERDWAIRQLRPFVASQRLYDQILLGSSENPATFDAAVPFGALCQNVLDTRKAALIALGPLAPLVPEPLLFMTEPGHAPPDIMQICPQCSAPDVIAVPLDAHAADGYTWAIPLWSERGLIGMLLLGEKAGYGFYTQEEIEVARASGERLVDAQAGVEIIRRLTDLQREQMVAAQVIDRQTRRTLHDEILPALHTSILSLGSTSSGHAETVKPVVQELSTLHRQISTLLRDLPAPFSPDIQRLGLLSALRNLVQEDLSGLFDRTTYHQSDGSEEFAAALPALTIDVLFYASREAIRNAAHHARGDLPLHLNVSILHDSHFQIVIEDNGVGIPFSKGISPNGSGQGLAIHSTLMAVIGGSLTIETKANQYTRVILAI
jgi:signal transduction histidine kinase